MNDLNDYYQKWIFEWVKEPSRELLGRNEMLEGWRIVTRPHQTPAQDSYLIAHDVFHHHPDDRGTYADEVFSFGAEMYMESETETFEQQASRLQGSWFSVMALTVDQGSRGLAGLLLSEKHPDLDLSPLEEGFKKLYIDSVRELKLDFYAYGDYEIWDRLLSRPQINRAASKMAQGYRWAEKQYPDPHNFLKLFNQVRKASEKSGQLGDTIVIEQRGMELSINHQPKVQSSRPRFK